MKLKKRVFFSSSKLGIFLFYALLLVGIYQLPLKLMGTHFQNIPGDLADGRLNNYFLEHGYLFFTGKIHQYWNGSFMYPEKNVITYSDNLLGTLPIYAVFRFFGCTRESAYQGWMLALFTLNFIIAAYALHKLSGNLSIASVGAYLFAFSLPIAAQMNHSQVFPRFIIPVVFMWLIFFFKNKKISHFAGVVLGIVFQFYAGIYLGFLLSFCVFISAIFLLFYTYNFQTFFQNLGNKKIMQLIGITLFAVLLLLPLLYPYYQRTQISEIPSYAGVVRSIPYIKSYLFAWKGAICWSFLTSMLIHVSIHWDHYLFPGGIALISLLLFPIIAYKNRKNKFSKEAIGMFLATAVIIILTIQINGFSLYKMIYTIPGFSSMRAIGRIINVLLFLFALIVVYLLCWVEKSIKYKNVFFVFIAIASVIDQYSTQAMPAYNKKESQLRVLNIENKLRAKNYKQYNAFAFIPSDEKQSSPFVQLDGMMASQDLQIPTVNGYTATSPGEFTPFWNDHDSISLQYWLNLKKMDIIKDKILLIK
ncbi:MAG: hypothetical protein ABI199_05080 [Bacteroidia bacterium]